MSAPRIERSVADSPTVVPLNLSLIITVVCMLITDVLFAS